MLKAKLSDQLKQQTKNHHQALEKQIIPLIKAIRTPDDYSRLLVFFYTFFGGLELLIDKYINKQYMPDFLMRRKTALLADDLHAMNSFLQAFAIGSDLPKIENHLQAAGALYVIEGSTLGGTHISKMINDQLNSSHPNSLTFFDGYKNDTQQMWLDFRNNIDDMPLNKDEDAVVVHAANETFMLFANWIKQH